MKAAGEGFAPMAAGFSAAVLLPAKAFIEAEDAGVQLQNTLMGKDGNIPAAFKQIGAQAVELGNLLPGTTADFMAMASQLKSLGVTTETIIGGALKATSYLAVVGKPLGVTYESAAGAVGKLGNALGIAANDLVPFADSLQRALHIGVDLTELQYALAKTAGPLKVLRKQGIGVANDMMSLAAMLIKAGISGEEAGTGLKKIIEVAGKEGKFTSIPNLVKDLEKLQKMNPAKMLEFMEKAFGGDAGKAAVIAMGGYEQTRKQFAEQAALELRIKNSLGTLGNLWEAATGTFTNAMVAFAEAYSPELKELVKNINGLSESLLNWNKQNPATIKNVLMAVGGLVAFKGAALAASIAFGLLNTVTKMSPLGLAVRALVIAAPFIIQNWDAIVAAFKVSVPVISAAMAALGVAFGLNPLTTFLSLAVMAVGAIIANWDKIKPYFDAAVQYLGPIWNDVKAAWFGIWDGIAGYLGISAESISAIWDGIKAFWSASWDGIMALLTGNTDQLSSIWDRLKTAWLDTWKGIARLLGEIIDNMIAGFLRKFKLLGPLLPDSLMRSANETLAEIGQRQAVLNTPFSTEQTVVKMPGENPNNTDRPLVQTPSLKEFAQRQSILSPKKQAVTGRIDVNFANAPAGMRVEPAKSKGPLTITPNVGYRSFATRMP